MPGWIMDIMYTCLSIALGSKLCGGNMEEIVQKKMLGSHRGVAFYLQCIKLVSMVGRI